VRATKQKVIIVAVLVALCLSVGVAYAFFFATAPEQTVGAQTGIVKVLLREDFPVTDDNGASIETTKTFSAENTGTAMAYVRARVFPSPEYHFIGLDGSGASIDEWRPLALPISAFTITTTSPAWVDGGDGFLYYSKILDPGDPSTDVTVSLVVNDPSQLPAGLDIRLNVRVTLESSQVTNDAYKTVFGISSLPIGVETLTTKGAGV